MKKIILIVLLAIGMFAKAQITLEQTYDSASTTDPPYNQLMIINFEISGDHYVRINRVGKTIDIYKMNHTLDKTISYASFPQVSNNIPYFLYFSENLFNTDSKIEFMYCYSQGYPVAINYTRIYNEDGLLIFQADSLYPWEFVTTPQQQFPIYNTSQGTKLILSSSNGYAKVFSLPGTLSTSIAEANRQLVQAQNGAFGNLYPNPSNGAVTLQYQLPEGEQTGELVLYNMQGAEVKRYKVDNTFKDLLLDNSQLQAGTYFYQLQTGKGEVGIKKMIVVK